MLDKFKKNWKHHVAKVMALLFGKIVIKPLQEIINLTHYYAIKKQFGEIGDDSFIEYPFRIINPGQMFIGQNFKALSGLRLQCITEHMGQRFSPELIIGNDVEFNSNCHVGCCNKVKIGDNTLIASNVYISDHFHGFIDSTDLNLSPINRPLNSKGPVNIGRNVWIGQSAMILPGISIGDNAIIGAGTIVTKDIPMNAVAGGVPARILKYL